MSYCPDVSTKNAKDDWKKVSEIEVQNRCNEMEFIAIPYSNDSRVSIILHFVYGHQWKNRSANHTNKMDNH